MIALIEKFTWLDWALLGFAVLSLIVSALEVWKLRLKAKVNRRKWRPRSAWIDDP